MTKLRFGPGVNTRMKNLRSAAQAMKTANLTYESKLKIVLPRGRQVYVILPLSGLWFTGTIDAYTLPDDGEVSIRPDEKYSTVLAKLLCQRGCILVHVNDIELLKEDLSYRLANDALRETESK